MKKKQVQAKFLPPKSDVAFKELMRNETVRRQFISDVLGIPPEEIREARLENPFLRRRGRREKEGILDVRLQLNNDRKVNIELQIKKVSDWDKRSLFYLSKMYSEEGQAGEDYARLKKCIVICILDFNWDARPNYHKVYYMQDHEGYLYSDQFEVHVIELNKELTGDRLDDWIRLFRVESMEELDMIQIKNPSILKVVEEVKAMNLGKRVRIMHEEQMRINRDRLYLRNNAIAEGRAEGQAEGLAMGRAEGERQSVLELLEDMGKIPEDIQNRIRAEENTETLRRWLKAAAKATSFDDFREKMV